jgi:hypothetical protein
MAENKEAKVLIDVKVRAEKALTNLAALRTRAEELKREQEALKETYKFLAEEMKKVDTSTQEGADRCTELQKQSITIRQEYEATGQQIKALNARANEYQKEIQSNIKHEHEQEGSLQRLKSELSLNTAAYNKLSEAERNSVKGSAYLNKIRETTEELNKAEQEMLNFHRQVGNYAIAGKELKKELEETANKLLALAEAGQKGSEEYKELVQRAIELKEAQNEVNGDIGEQADKIDALSQILGGVSAAFGAYATMVGMSAEDEKEFAEAMRTMTVAMTALTTVTQIQNLLRKQGAAHQMAEMVLQKLHIKQTDRQIAAEAALNKVKTSGSIVTKAVAAAQWLWNAALAANPVILVAVAIIALIAGIYALTKAFDSSAKAEKEATKASEAYEAQQQKTAAAIDNINHKTTNAVNERKNKLREEIIEMQKNGATAEQMAKVKMKAEQDVRDIEIAASKEREKQKYKEYQASLKNIDAAKAVLATTKTGSKEYKEQLKVINDLIKAHNGLAQSINDERQSQIDNNLASQEAAQADADAKKKKYQDNALKALEAQKKLQDEQNKLTETGMSQDFITRQKWEEKNFLQTQEHEKKKLDMQKHFGQITKTEYDAQYALLDAQAKTFQQTQLKGLQNHYAEQQKTIVSLLGQSVDAQIKDVEEKYRKASDDFQKLMAVPEPQKVKGQSDEDYKKELEKWQAFKLEQAFFEIELDKKKAQEIEAIRNGNLAKTISEIETLTSKQYDDELAKFTDNEREKNRIEIEMAEQNLSSKKMALQKLLDEGKISQQEYNREIYEDEAKLRALQSQQNQLNLNSDLLATHENAKAKYEARKAYLEKEAELYQDNADKQKEIAAELAENEKEYLQERIETFEEWSGRTMELMNGLNELVKANEAAELQEYEEDNEKKKASLQQRLDAGKISQEQYDKEVAKLDADLDKKKTEIARKQATREKLLKVFDIGINTAAAIMKNTAQLGLLPAIPVNIATGVLGAIQLATVLATPLPKAARGRIIHGPSHAAGGTIIEAEGGEAIINKRSTALFAPLLSAINQAGGGVPFVRPLSDGGYAARNAQPKGITAEEIKEAMKEAVSHVKVYTTIEDIRREDKNYADIEQRANY